MPEVTDYQIIQMMHRYGGHFANAIALAADRADEANLVRLKHAFPDLWEEYRKVWIVRNEKETK